MRSSELQGHLNDLLGLKLAKDGVLGKQSLAAMDRLLAEAKVDGGAWALERQALACEQLVLRKLGIEVGEVDGLLGPQTRYAREVYEGRKKTAAKQAEVEVFKDKDLGAPVKELEQGAKWPRQRDVEAFYGKPGQGLVMLTLPFSLRIAWDPEKLTARVQVHGECREAFEVVWKRTLDHYGLAEVKRLRLDLFGGCLASPPRLMRGGSRGSMHNYACAWDVDPDRNQLRWGKDKAQLDDKAYEAFWAIVRAAGGLALGPTKNYDWMHFQFTRDFS